MSKYTINKVGEKAVNLVSMNSLATLHRVNKREAQLIINALNRETDCHYIMTKVK